MRRPATLLVLAALLAPALGADDDELVPVDRNDLSGIWRTEATDLVVDRTGVASWIGYPTDIGGVASGRTWHFQFVGDDVYEFWIILEGKATSQKLDEQTIRVPVRADELSLRISPEKGKAEEWKWARVCAAIPEKLGEVLVGFVPPRRMRVPPNQLVDTRLVRLLQRAVPAARDADPGLKRINVGATIEVPFGSAHSRYVRRAIAIDRVNGADADHWREDVEEKLDAIEAGEEPRVDLRRDYARHATALVLALLAEEDVESVVCPAILDADHLPYLEWWIRKYGRDLPRHAPSISGWRKKFEEVLDATKSSRGRLGDWLQVTVKAAEGERPRKRKSMDKRYDRE